MNVDAEALAEQVLGLSQEEKINFLLNFAERLGDERDRLRAVVEAAQTLITELDANPIGEYGDAVCEAIDALDDKLKALDGREGT